MHIEEDGDEVFTSIDDGCSKCVLGFTNIGDPHLSRAIYAKIEPVEETHAGKKYLAYRCTNCNVSYNLVPMEK